MSRLILAVLLFLFSQILFSQNYCVPTVLNNTGKGITRFRLATIDHNSPAGEGMRDTNLTKAAGTATLTRGSTVNILVDLPQAATITVWIDDNKNGIFFVMGMELKVGAFAGVAGTNIVPLNVGGPLMQLGLTRLRISAGTNNLGIPCSASVADGDVEDYLVNIIDQNMRHDSTLVKQPLPCCYYPGKVRKEVLAFEINTSYLLNPLILKDVIFSTAGTTTMNDISNAELWYTGIYNTNGAPPNYGAINLSNRVLFGNLLSPPSPTYTISGTYTLTPNTTRGTTHYFWLSYDISAGATIGNTIDVSLLQFVFDSSGVNITKTPVNGSPAGFHTISAKTSYPTTNRANVWYFGENAGIDFNCSPPTATADSRLSASETTSSMCDPNGNLLFYTNGETVWDASHERMQNGTGLKGHFLVSSGAQIIPDPGNPNQYYLFTSKQGHDTLFYSKIDMTLNGGLGAVINKNTFVATNIQEAKAVVHHCNGKDVWLAVLKDVGSFNYRLRTYLINSAGIQAPVINTSYNFSGNGSYWGQQHFSPNGQKYAIRDFSPTGVNELIIVDFDNYSGVFCDTTSILLDSTICGVSFSPDNSKLYVIDGSTRMKISQFDMNAGSKNAIRASKINVGNIIPAQGSFIQNGPDGKTYISQMGPGVNDEVLHVINQPNLSGASCNLQYNVISLASRGQTGQSLFPKFIDSYFLDPTYSEPFDAIITADTASCDGDSVTFTNSSLYGNHSCSGWPDYSWNFGDPGSGAANTSTLNNPTHLFTAPGTYTVSLYIQERCKLDTATHQIIVYPNANASITGNNLLCIGDSTTLVAAGGTTFTWNTGSTNTSITVTPTGSSLYTLTVSNGICTDTTSVYLNVLPAPVALITGTDTICAGANITLTASGGSSYLWNTGTGTSTVSISPTTNTMYSVTVTTGSCTDTTSINITVNPSPTAIISGGASICAGYSVTLSANGGSSYTWSTGSTSTSITVTPTGSTSYSLIATTGSCSDTTNLYLNVSPTPTAYAGPDTTLCEGSSITLVGSGGNAYTWSNGVNTQNNSVSPTLSTLYSMTTSIGACSDTDEVMVTLAPLPVITTNGNATILFGSSANLSATTITGASYYWSPSNGLSCTNCQNPVANPTTTTKYFVTVVDSNGCTTLDSLIITVDIKCPELYIPTAFSPNGDGQNDVFFIRGDCFVNFYLVIYDRWGEKIYETSDKKFEWNGTFKSKLLNTAVFTYIVNGDLLTGESVSQKGNITLIR